MKRILAMCLIFALLLPCAAGAEVRAHVTDTVINTVNPYIFGDNLSWRGDGYQAWDAETGALDEGMIEAFANSGITTLRYPGGIEASYFHWNESIGENRVAQIDPFSRDWPTEVAQQGALFEPNFGFDEFVEFCERTNIVPSIILNVGNGTPREAADWILYCVEKGIELSAIDVGNEENFWHEQVPGMHIAKTEQQYIDFFNELYGILETELTAEQLDALNIGVIGLPNNHPLCVRKTWDKQILNALSDRVDYFDVHIGYSTYNVNNASNEEIATALMASATWVGYMLKTVKTEIQKYSGEHADDVEIHISEMGPMTGSQHYNSVAGALFQADLFNLLLREPMVTAANHLPCINHYAAANVVGTAKFPVVSKDEGRVFWKNPVSYVFDVYSPLSNQQVLDVAVEADETFNCKGVGLMTAVKNVAVGDVAAYRDADGVLTLMILNRDVKNKQDFTITLPAASALDSAQQLYHKNQFAYNNWTRREYVQMKDVAADVALDGQTLSITCPPVSMTVIKLVPAQ